MTQASLSHYSLPNLCAPSAVLLQVIVAELIAICCVLISKGLFPFDWQLLALISLYLQWVVLLSAGLLCRLRSLLTRLSLFHGAMLCYMGVLIVNLISSVLAQWFLSGAIVGGADWSVDIVFILRNILVAAVIAGIVLRYLFLAELLNDRRQAELKSRLDALQSRIKPHFLFNTMNSIASLIAVDADAAEHAVEDLCTLFRASFTDSVQVRVSEELELCRRYVAIEQLRLGDRLCVNWRVEAVPPNLLIPNLSLQPLIENAIYHGIQELPSGGEITVNGYFKGNRVHWKVSNPSAESDSIHEGHGIAVENIRRRLEALYGDDAQLNMSKSDNIFTCELHYRPIKVR